MPNWLIRILLYFFLLVGFGLLGVVIWTVFQDDRLKFSGLMDWEYAKNLGGFGEFMNISWSILGVLLIYLTLNLQKRQTEETNNFIEKQQFETTFFNMMNVLFNIKQAMEGEVKFGDSTQAMGRYKGQEFIDQVINHLRFEYFKYYDGLGTDNKIKPIIDKVTSNRGLTDTELSILKDDLNEHYLSVYGKYHSELGHYLRYLYNLIKFTIDHRKKYHDDARYVNLIQAQLSNNELALVFYNAISDNGLNSEKIPKFFNWLEEYEFLENMDDRSLIFQEHHSIYRKTRFKFLNVDELALKSSFPHRNPS